GLGCIILLHGVPGVGKTSTADIECVAAHTNKPLYPITCGDIGYRPEDLEKNMEKHFGLAHRWGCVLLLDEADVFLVKRDRNGLVSVFLRILEYYSGILFLTTNRVGTIDDAFRSRLHLTLYYPKLTSKQTKQIFKRNFRRIADINADRHEKQLPLFAYKDVEPRVMQWASQTRKLLMWNGRQIRNVFQTALALAEFQAAAAGSRAGMAVEVKRRHFKIVADASVQFNEYLMATHGADEDKVAGREYVSAMELAAPKVERGREEVEEISE
ncbi:P-loop containing nucleoside triphosphate hydrolase protein, partial [Bombardia bombarda]